MALLLPTVQKVPNAADWFDAGKVILKMGADYGYDFIGKTRLVHDVLIALSARRLGIAIVTDNLVDFQRIARYRPVKVYSALDFRS